MQAVSVRPVKEKYSDGAVFLLSCQNEGRKLVFPLFLLFPLLFSGMFCDLEFSFQVAYDSGEGW